MLCIAFPLLKIRFKILSPVLPNVSTIYTVQNSNFNLVIAKLINLLLITQSINAFSYLMGFWGFGVLGSWVYGFMGLWVNGLMG